MYRKHRDVLEIVSGSHTAELNGSENVLLVYEPDCSQLGMGQSDVKRQSALFLLKAKLSIKCPTQH